MYVPGLSNVTSPFWPGFKGPVSNPCPVAVCVTESLFVQRTVSPAFTVSSVGLNANPSIVTSTTFPVGSTVLADVSPRCCCGAAHAISVRSNTKAINFFIFVLRMFLNR